MDKVKSKGKCASHVKDRKITLLYSLGIPETVNPKMKRKPDYLSMGETVTVTRTLKETWKH
jgi:hypothetical protein